MGSIFYKDWIEKLEDHKIFEPDDEEKLVTKKNVEELITALDL